MNPSVLFRPAAERELLEAERWFEERQPELGHRFRVAVGGTIERVRELPLAFPIVHGQKRRSLVPGFPYAIYFALSNDTIVIVGVVHGRRDPTVWRSRR